VRCLHCFFDSPVSGTRLAQSLHQLGQVSLLVDMHGRVFDHSPTCSMFDCKQQLERGTLYTLPQTYGDGWYAPGIRGDEPGLWAAAQGYDCVVLDAGLIRTGLMRMPGARHAVIIEVQPAHDSMLRAYTLLKTLFHFSDNPGVTLLGNPAACDHVWAACSQFLEPLFAQAICSVASEEDVFAALAIRIVGEMGEEKHLSARTTMGISLNHAR
jgi:hypothetical protein